MRQQQASSDLIDTQHMIATSRSAAIGARCDANFRKPHAQPIEPVTIRE